MSQHRKDLQSSVERRPRKAAYALPTLFTSANIFLGFYAILETFKGALLAGRGEFGTNTHFMAAAVAIGWAVACDGLDGRIARMTNTVSDFGREMDSLADVITFGIAPAVLAFAWGIQFVEPPLQGVVIEHLRRAGYFLAFLYLLCGAARLARFNVTANPVPKNPGRPDRKYFVGMPIPAAAGTVASVVYAADGVPVRFWVFAAGWLGLVALLAFLMVSTWRYASFKDINLLRPRSPLSVVFFGTLIYLIWHYSQPVLLGLSIAYMLSGILVRLGGLLRRRVPPQSPEPEHQLG
jgi:CDP-diacylglycerol--serine O-phosphatidyltransferase